MIREGIDSIELAFESLTEILKKHIVVFDMEPYYMFDDELNFTDELDTVQEISNYHKGIKEVLVRMLDLVNTNGDTDEFNDLLDHELPYL
jgi:hypothetical protein